MYICLYVLQYISTSTCGPNPEPENLNGDWLDRAQRIAQQSTCVECPSNGAFNIMPHLWSS